MYCLKCGCQNGLSAKFCTNCGAPTPLADETKTGKIIVNREQSVFAFAITFTVWVDDIKIGILANGETLSTPISFGPHEVKLTSTEKPVSINVEIYENNNVAIVTVIPKMGLIAARPFVKNIEYRKD